MASKAKKPSGKKPLKKGGSSSTRRPAKPTKAEKVEVSAPGKDPTVPPLLAGNMPPIKDILYHLEQIAGYQAKAKTASMAVTKAKNAAKEAGVDLKSLAEGQGLIGMDPLNMATYFRQLQAIMREKGLPIQIQLFETKYGSVEEQAMKEGWDAGIAGRSPDTARWPEGTPGHEQHMRGWNDAQRHLVTKGATGSKAANDEDEDKEAAE